MKRLLALCCVIGVLVLLCACGGTEKQVQASESGTAASVEVQSVGDYLIPTEWREETLDDGIWGYTTQESVLSGQGERSIVYPYVVVKESAEDTITLTRYEFSGEEADRVTVPLIREEGNVTRYISRYCYGTDCLWVVETTWTLVNEENGEVEEHSCLKKFTMEGQEVCNVPMEKLTESEGDFITDITMSPEGTPVLLTLEAMIFCDSEGTPVAEGAGSPGYAFARDSAGRVYCQDTIEGKLYTMDWEACGLGEMVMELSGNASVSPGAGEYDFLLNTGSALQGVSLTKGTVTEFVRWYEADLSDMVGGVAMLDEEHFLVSVYDLLLKQSQMLTIARVPADELPEKTPVTMAVALNPATAEWGGTWSDSLDEMVVAQMTNFNRSSEQYRVECVTFSSTEELQLMMLSGSAPDIICWKNLLTKNPSIDLFAKKGYLRDLEPLFEEDGELSLDDFIPSVIELEKERADGLYAMPFQFYLTTVTAPVEYVGEDPEWSVSAMLDLARRMPEDMSLWHYMTRDDIVRVVLQNNSERFVQPGEGTCDFQNQEFYDLLTLARDYFPASVEDDAYQNPRGEAMLTGELVLGRMGQFASDTLRNVESEGKTFVGYPGDTGNGFTMCFASEFSICATGSQPEGAWEFLRTLYEYDFQYTSGVVMHAVRDDAFHAREDWYLEVNGSCTEEESQAARALVYDVKSFSNYATPVVSVVLEEVGAFFTGDKTAEAVAEIVESRVKIYLSEQS